MRVAESGRVENAVRSPQHLPTVELPWRSSELDGASLEPVERHRLCGRYRPPVEDFSGDRAAILRRYLELAPGARPFFPVDRHAPLDEFERIVNDYPVFRVA